MYICGWKNSHSSLEGISPSFIKCVVLCGQFHLFYCSCWCLLLHPPLNHCWTKTILADFLFWSPSSGHIFWFSVLAVLWLRIPGTTSCIGCCIIAGSTNTSTKSTTSSPWVNIHSQKLSHTRSSSFISPYSSRPHLACRQSMPTQLRPSSSVLVSLLESWSSVTMSSSCGPGCLFGCWRPLMSTGRTR